MIRGTCPLCGRAYRVDDRYAGKTGKCKTCGAAINVPGEPDEGLDGLPELAADAPTPPAEAAPEPEPELEQEPEPEPPAPAPPEPHEPAPTTLDDSSHDSRSRYEPGHGPTALEGRWLTQEPGAAAAPPEPEPPSRADEVLGTSRMLISEESLASDSRPRLIAVACVVLGALAVAFFVQFIVAGLRGAGSPLVGMAVGVVGLAAGGLGAFRLWRGHWDGLVAGLLFCVMVVGGELLLAAAAAAPGRPARLSAAITAFLCVGGATLLLLFVSVLFRSGREHLAR